MVGVFDSPDGCSVWCSVTLGRLIDMLPPSPPSPRLLFLHLLLQHSHCYEDGYQPFGLQQQTMGWDFSLTPARENVNVWDRADDTHLPLSDGPRRCELILKYCLREKHAVG